MFATQTPYPTYTDTDGYPLDAGYVYFGVENQDPVANPTPVYWDAAGTQPVAQPAQTLNGFTVRAGTPTAIYAPGAYSIKVVNRRGATVYQAASVADTSGALQAEGIANAVRTDLANSSDAAKGDALVAVKRSASGAVATTLHAWVEKQVVNVRADFGAVGDGAADDTVAIQAAINAFPSGRATIFLPPGTYKITAPLVVSKDRVHIVGAGSWATQILFAPTANGAAIRLSANGPVLFQGSVRGLSFYSNDATFTKAAIEVEDTSGYLLDDVVVGGGVVSSGSSFWSGAGSMGLHIKGREALKTQRLYIYADKPIRIAGNPNNSIDADHFHFADSYLCANGNPCVTIDDGVNLTHCRFDGYNPWVRGTHGLYWNDTTAAGVSTGLHISGVRTEQGESASSYAFHIAHNYGVQQVSFEGCYGGLDRRGYFLRNIKSVSLRDCWHIGASNEALNVDASVVRINIANCYWETGSTASTPGMRRVWATPMNPSTGALPPNAIYDAETAGRNHVIGGAIGEQDISVANDAVAEIAISGACGLLVVTDSEGLVGTFALKGTYNTVTEVNDPFAVYSVTAGTASMTNVYWDAGASRYMLQNKRGAARRYRIALLGSHSTF